VSCLPTYAPVQTQRVTPTESGIQSQPTSEVPSSSCFVPFNKDFWPDNSIGALAIAAFNRTKIQLHFRFSILVFLSSGAGRSITELLTSPMSVFFSFNGEHRRQANGPLS
jgi:hypothetical protein